MTPTPTGDAGVTRTEAMSPAEAIAYLKPDPSNNGTISLRAPKAREAVAVIEAALRLSEHRLMVRTRQCTRGPEMWCRAAEEAFAGRPQNLRLKVEMHRAPPVDVVLSEEADHAE